MIKEEVSKEIGGKMDERQIAELIGLVSSRMIIEDHAKNFS